MNKEMQDYKKAMLEWVKKLIEWQLRNPEKDWLQEMGTADVEGGDHPPTPPPKP